MTLADFYEGGFSLTELYAPLTAMLVLIVATMVYLARNKIRRTWLNLKTRTRLNRLGVKVIADYRFPDGLGNYFTIDRLVLREDGISVLVFNQYPGSIFCADDIAEWTQLLGGRSYRFRNPLIDLGYLVKAISAAVPGVAVDGYVFFGHQAEFPKGRPAQVIDLYSIPQSLQRVKKATPRPPVMTAWEKLNAVSV